MNPWQEVTQDIEVEVGHGLVATFLHRTSDKALDVTIFQPTRPLRCWVPKSQVVTHDGRTARHGQATCAFMPMSMPQWLLDAKQVDPAAVLFKGAERTERGAPAPVEVDRDAPGATAHNGTYTIVEPNGSTYGAPEGRKTWRIKTQSAEATFAPSARILAYLSAPDQFTGIGFVNHGRLSSWKKFVGTAIEAEGARALEILNRITAARYERAEAIGDADEVCDRSTDTTILVSTRCCVCNRALTTPESIRSGIGPICAGRD